MKLKKLFQKQAELDEHIVDKKGLQGQDLTQQKIIAFKVELSEMLNEWRGFKFWSEDQEPRFAVRVKCDRCKGDGRIEKHSIYGSIPCPDCDNPYGGMKTKNPLLEEYIDGVHFLLSIGIERGYDKWLAEQRTSNTTDSVTVEDFAEDIFNNPINSAGKWLRAMLDYLSMGQELGFSDNDIYRGYMDKNKVNHTRQESGY